MDLKDKSVVVTGVVSGDLLHLLLALRRAGHPVTLVETAGSPRPAYWPKTQPPDALHAQGITYYMVDAIGRAREIEELVF